MNCEICKVRPAKVHYTEVVNNQMTKMNLCLECAEEKGVDVQKAGNFGLGDLVAGLIDTAVDADAERISAHLHDRAVWCDASKNYRDANHALVSNKSDFNG